MLLFFYSACMAYLDRMKTGFGLDDISDLPQICK
jgi:hypothetical protein